MTLAELLHQAETRLRTADIEDARLEAELLLRHAIGLTREALYASLRQPAPPQAPRTLEALLLRRLAHEPTAYIVRHKEFYGLELLCTPAALVPRPETELLVEEALAWLDRRGKNSDSPLIVDVGTGNGAIAVALAAHASKANVVAIDTSRPALALACRNAEAHAVASRIEFVHGNMLTSLRTEADLIVANLPYIPSRLYGALPPEIQEYEPRDALHAGRRGTSVIERLLVEAAPLLKPDGLLLAEHAWNQGAKLREAARAAFRNARVETKRDLAGRERLLVVETS